MFEWESRMTHLISNNQGTFIGFSTTGRGYAVEIADNSLKPNRCLASIVSNISGPSMNKNSKHLDSDSTVFLTHTKGWAKESTGYVVKSVALSTNAIITTFPEAPQVNNPCRVQATNTWNGNSFNADSD